MTIALLMFATGLLAQADTGRFHQGVDYRIEASLEEGTDILHGRARLRYTNHSPATLDTLWFHQHLNAFRPNSAWARRELEFGNRRFQDLGPRDHAFERLTRVTVDGRAATPVYRGAPDSTVVAIPLATRLAPGQSVTVVLDWDARLATLPRRQGRQGRRYDFAQWYPRIAVYDSAGWQVQPLMPQGEFYGEIGSYDVTVEVAADQVIGATGVPVEGDPGWSKNARTTGPIDYRRNAYPAATAEGLGLLDGSPAAGQKRVRWRAEDVHHFGWSMNPEYVYEGGVVPRSGAGGSGDIGVHVLYLPTDTAWDDGVVLGRTQGALAWLQTMFGPYIWPQVTTLHRIETGGTEFPMVLMNGSPSEGLIVHEGTHQYLHGMLANNEFKEGWLDEGFTSFMDFWYLEDKGRTDVWTADMDTIREWDRKGLSEPVAIPSADFRDPYTYSRMTYTKASLVLRMLRELIGADTMRAVLREFYRRHAPGHVTEADLKAAAESVSGRELGWFFEQWLHTTNRLDYGISQGETTRLANGRWRTRLTVVRQGDAWMPVTLRVAESDRLLESRDRTQTIEVVTDARPAEALLDPSNVLIDFDPSNNRRSL